MDGICLKTGFVGIKTPITAVNEIRKNPSQITTTAAINRMTISSDQPSMSASSAPHDAVLADGNEEVKEESEGKKNDENWVLKILHVRSMWSDRNDRTVEDQDQDQDVVNCKDEGLIDEHECDACKVDYDGDGDDDDAQIEFDRSSFSKLLRRVSLGEARLYSQMCYLGSLAYSIPRIKPGKLLKDYRLRFVTSSLEKKAQLAAIAEKEKEQVRVQELEENAKKKEDETTKSEKETASEIEQTKETVESGGEKGGRNLISASTAYNIAASAASYLHSQTKNIIPFKSSENNDGEVSMTKAEVASFMATTDSVTAVVAAKEEVKQAVADELNSLHSSPCEWFVCDDDESTRYFVIQGSESLASWQANLLFEPIQFEGLDVIVHRGIYEAAKGIYDQMLPEIHEHLQHYGDKAKFRFTGHSLGGSLALLVNLMLLIRGQVPRTSLLSVITFGSPSVMCGGDRLLHKLGLPKSHLQAITLHRDIVPRAFSCKYPSRVAELLKAVNGNFRNHPCLDNQRLLYAPMGEFLILQPDAKLSPNHDLLPSGSGLYVLTSSVSDMIEAEKQVKAAQSVFLNTPHPLEILSDRSAYGSGGAIQRDHDMESYLVSVQSVIRQELNRARKGRREQRRRAWWPLVAPRGNNRGRMGPGQSQGQMKFTRVLHSGSESLKRFTSLVASDHMGLLVILLLPAKLLFVEACNVIRHV
ncbi:putative fungal lipase-like domain, alpha/Beta hydrolase, phospholipase A1 PLIP1/2/3 [Helianthus annuus]|nr:putative fungal lipase-like domain, alpha/Beta hydrolase, phospholipase A1 PLIP1/2/3 [Helianthus annuus]KAJ0758380.1 putative fungal lipase-like domain, alpha/Beta hydrolase, phospholipase A1 PLIP1/2/3 [Helianthus annuus]